MQAAAAATLLVLGSLSLLSSLVACGRSSVARSDVAPEAPVTLTSARPPSPSPSAARSTPASEPFAPAHSPSTLKAQMREHDLHGAAMRDAVARADLEAARREARLLADLRVSDAIEPPWRKQVDAMNAAAARAAEAKDLPAISRDVAAVARTCGACHATLGGPGLTVGEAPEAASGVVPRMRRHYWAAARLWDGLVAPSQEAWRAGAAVLADAPLEPDTLTPGKSPAPAIATLASSVHELGHKARVVSSSVDRAAVYAELLTTCSACHLRLGGGPPEQPRH